MIVISTFAACLLGQQLGSGASNIPDESWIGTVRSFRIHLLSDSSGYAYANSRRFAGALLVDPG